MGKKQTKGINLNITEEQFIQECNRQASDAIDQLTKDPVLRELITSMDVDPDEIADMIRKDMDEWGKPK